MSDYVKDLQAVLGAGEAGEFLVPWRQFRDAHYPGKSHSDALLDAFALIYAQVEPGLRWRLFYLFCQNRSVLAREDFESHRVLFDAYRLVSHLAEMLAIQPLEIETAATQMRAMAGAEEAWQYDRILNWLIWRRGDSRAILDRQQALLESGEINALYGMQVHSLPARHMGMHPAAMAGGTELPAEAWRYFGFQAGHDQGWAKVSAPFCFDTNHLDGVGLFCLIASCDLKPFGLPNGLTNARIRLSLRTHVTAPPHRIFLGIGGPLPEEAALDQPRSDYWLRDLNLGAGQEFEGEVDLPPDPDAWLPMGRNPLSPPYFAYTDVPISRLLPVATGIFLVLMQDGDPHPKQGTIQLGRTYITLP